ncbi:AMP-binding enzyme [Lactiplantibacillus garii]|uniref:AMP-binding enzyme n=1 Tax=Lactiplantibacillus garii TaxID=2306423 RepID=UPI0013155701|nr:hypothetical protein [Lactiplantibacillus garii]
MIERELLRHPHIQEAAAVGLKDHRLGEIIGAFIVATPGNTGLTLTMIKNFLAARGVAKKFWPEKIKIVAQLPRTSSGKVKKHQLVLAAQTDSPIISHDHAGHDSGWGVTMEA